MSSLETKTEGVQNGETTPTQQKKHQDPAIVDGEDQDVAAVFGISGQSTPTTASPKEPFSAGKNGRAVEDLIASKPMPKPKSATNLAQEKVEHQSSVESDVEALNAPSSPRAASPKLVTPQRQVGRPIGSHSPSNSPSYRRDDLCHPIQIKSDAISETLLPSGKQEEPNGKKKKPPPTELPSELLMPITQRCDFCIKFDSVCSMCHFKWKDILKERQKTMLAHFKVMPEIKRVGIFFAAIARGPIEFVKALLDANPQGVGWFAKFNPLHGDAVGDAFTRLGAIFDRSGRVFPLHIAMAYRRLDVAEALMNAGATVRRSENKVLPTEFLKEADEHSLPDDWENMLEQQNSYTEHCMSERARTLRNEKHFEDAALEYEALLQINPKNEHAICGLAKMKFDQGLFTDCVAECDKILKSPDMVTWVEFLPETVASLRERAVAEFHTKAHAVDGPAWVKECGCIVTERTVVSLRRIPFGIIRDHILPYMNGQMLYQLWRAVRVPLIQRATEHTASVRCDSSVGLMLSNEFGYPEMYESIRTDLPKAGSTIAAPMQFLGLQVCAMGDFHTFILKGSVVGSNPKWKKRFFESDELPKRVVVTKQFRVNRAALGKAWDVHEAGEWEVDDKATLVLDKANKK